MFQSAVISAEFFMSCLGVIILLTLTTAFVIGMIWASFGTKGLVDEEVKRYQNKRISILELETERVQAQRHLEEERAKLKAVKV